MSEEAKKKLLKVLPYLRDAIQQAKQFGSPRILIVAQAEGATDTAIASFNGEEFIRDICLSFGVPPENNEEENLDARALEIVQNLEAVGIRKGPPDGTSGN